MSDPAGRIALDITATSNVAEVAKARSEVSALGDAAKKSADMTRVAFEQAGGDLTKMAQIYQRLTTTVQQTTTAVAQQTTVVREAETAWDGFSGGGRRMQSTFVSMAFAGEAFTRSMSAGDGALRRVFRSLSMLGFLGGPELGIATTAISAIGDGLVDMWTRSEKAAQKAQVQFEKSLEALSRGTVEAASEAQRNVYSGDPFARRGSIEGETDAQFLARSRGLVGVQGALSALGPSAGAAGTNAFNAAIAAGRDYAVAMGAAQRASNSFVAAHAALIEQEARLRRELTETTEVTTRLMGVEQNRARAQLEQWQDRQSRRSVGGMPLDPSELRRRGRGGFGLDTISDISQGPPENLSYLGELKGKEMELEAQLHRTNITYSERLRLQHELAQTEMSVSAYGTVSTEDRAGGNPFRIRAARLIVTPAEVKAMTDAKQLVEVEKMISASMATTMEEGLAAGIRAGFHGPAIKSAFAAGSKAILAGLGGMLIDEGKIYLEKAAIMEALVPHLFNPVTSGWAAAGIGAALIGLGATLEALGSGAGGGGGSAGGFAGSGSTFTPNAANAGGGTTVVIQTIDPLSRGVVQSTIYEINRSGMLNTPIVAPYGRPS